MGIDGAIKRRRYVKLLIASDIHGSAQYCELLLNKFVQEGAEKLILLGDLLYHGARNDLPQGYSPKQVTAMLNGMRNKILCVQGNCDSLVDAMVLQFPIMADYAVLFWRGKMCYLTHGHRQENLPLQPGDLLFCGHTHIPAFESRDGYTYINPGSVSLPKENSAHAYMLLDEDTLYLKDVTTGDIISVFSPFLPDGEVVGN